MFTVCVLSGGITKKIECQEEILLSEAVLKAGFSVYQPCAGNHTCGKCTVRATGALDEISEAEKKLLGGREGYRLACFAHVIGNAEITINEDFADTQVELKGIGSLTEFDGCTQGYGFAVDIGTTTVAVYLFDLAAHKLLCNMGAANRQAAFGADVISRINYSIENSLDPLHTSIVRQLDEMFDALLIRAQIKKDEVTSAVICGNTTMLHFLTGKNPKGIAFAPFDAESYFGYTMPMREIFISFSESAQLYLPKCIHSYVGADISCAIAATRLYEHTGNALLIDVGTNGEIALMSKGVLRCCSTAAGPAFEGAQIKMGMTASAGAICKTELIGNRMICTTIGHAPACGICGTGLISALALLLRLELVDETGRIDDESEYAHLICDVDGRPAIMLGDSGVVLTQQDIRSLQLAKAAIAAGVETLLHEADITAQSVDRFYLCGGFGSFIDYNEAVAIGLFPNIGIEKTVSSGNAAGSGAGMLLLSKKLTEQQEKFVDMAINVELSAHPYFMEKYIDNMSFGGAL